MKPAWRWPAGWLATVAVLAAGLASLWLSEAPKPPTPPAPAGGFAEPEPGGLRDAPARAPLPPPRDAGLPRGYGLSERSPGVGGRGALQALGRIPGAGKGREVRSFIDSVFVTAPRSVRDALLWECAVNGFCDPKEACLAANLYNECAAACSDNRLCREAGIIPWMAEDPAGADPLRLDGASTAGDPPPGDALAPPSGSLYRPFEVAAGAWVNSRLGVHWFSDIWGAVDAGARARALERMRALGAGYAVVLVHPDQPDRNDGVIRELQAAGITPVVRLYDPAPPDTWDDAVVARLVEAARRLAGLGVPLIQVGNEPNHAEGSNLAQRPGADAEEYVRRSIFNYARAMGAIKASLGDAVRVGTPPMAPGTPDSPAEGFFPSRDLQGPGYFSTMLEGFARYERNSGLRIVDWIATHTYANIGYEQGVQDAAWYPARASALLGRAVRALSTEGGPHPSQWASSAAAQVQASAAHMEADALSTDCLWPLYGDGWQRNALVEPAAGYEDALLWLDARY